MTEQHKEYIFEATKIDVDFYHIHSVKGELTRCKDCKYWRTNTQFCSVFSGLCTMQRMPPDGYCSVAERKEE